MIEDNLISDLQILSEIRFGFLYPYKLAGMGEPWVSRIKRTFHLLKEEGIGAIVTLTEDNIYEDYYRESGFIQLHEPVDDYDAPSFEGMDRMLLFIESCLNKDIGVAVHCAEGRGRTGTVLGAWLARKESLSPKDAIKRLYELRIHTALSPSQREFLHEYLKNIYR